MISKYILCHTEARKKPWRFYIKFVAFLKICSVQSRHAVRIDLSGRGVLYSKSKYSICRLIPFIQPVDAHNEDTCILDILGEGGPEGMYLAGQEHPTMRKTRDVMNGTPAKTSRMIQLDTKQALREYLRYRQQERPSQNNKNNFLLWLNCIILNHKEMHLILNP